MVARVLGHECATATTGREALALAREQRFDLAIIDIGLPDISGHDVARELRSLPGGSEMYLAAATGYGQPEDHARAMQAGFDQHVLKPLDVGIVKRIVMLAGKARKQPG